MDTPVQIHDEYIKNILTITHARHCTDRLRETHEALYEKNIDIKSKLEDMLPHLLSEALILTLETQHIPYTQIDKIQDVINVMKKAIEDIPVVELVLSFVPNNRQVKKISDWWDTYAGRHILLSIEHDDSLLTGAKISYKGVYADYSLSHFLESSVIH